VTWPFGARRGLADPGRPALPHTRSVRLQPDHKRGVRLQADQQSWTASCHRPGMRTHYPRHLSGFSYVGLQRYFLTFCTADRTARFQEAKAVDLVTTQFLRAGNDEEFAIIACCFMPDHVHLLVEGKNECADLKKFITRAKQFSGYEYSREFRKRLWQRYGYEHVLRDEESTRQVAADILENPVRAGLAKTVYDYPHLTSSEYSREALIEFVYHTYEHD
jgi:putative transposase